MEIVRDEQRKWIQVWMTNSEKTDPEVQAMLKPLYAAWKQKKYLVAVYQSGNQELYACTRDLLVYNHRRLAENAVRERKTASIPER